eukprot:GGOE01028936.1.p1 GENE.GGOE01028936.1~~GGOE01028936.1.p1  ORF type:complete len:1564 (-),score=498.96 GGOE01028936.1:365-4870(-)
MATGTRAWDPLQRESEWRKELAERNLQLVKERELAEERREQRAAERAEWEVVQKAREEELMRRELAVAEKQLELNRLRELEAELGHERAREEAFQNELLFEHDLKQRTLDAMEYEHAQASQRLKQILNDIEVSEVIQTVTTSPGHPAAALSVGSIIDIQLSDELRQQMIIKRDRERIALLALERERQRELEQRWAEQRIEDKLREEEARRIKLQVAQGELMDLPTLYKLKRRVLTEEEKQQVPNYVVSSLLRTIMDATDKECVALSIKILCRLMHGVDLDRKAKVCDAMINSLNGLIPIVQAFNRYQTDYKLLRQLLVLLKLCLTYSQAFVVVGLQQGVWDVANSLPVPGLQPEPFKDITSFTPGAQDGARQCLETLKLVLMMQPPDLFQCMRCLNGLKVDIPNSSITSISHMDFAFVLFDAGILVQDEFVWRYVIQLLTALCQRGNHSMVAKALITGKGRIFITHTLKMSCIASDLDLVVSTFEFVILTWMLDNGVAETYLEFKALSALVQAAERHPPLADHLYQLWETTGVGIPEVREILEEIAHCDQWSYDLRNHLFDLSVRFRPRATKNPEEPPEKEQLITFLSDHRGCTLLKTIWEQMPASWEAVIHVLWVIVQAEGRIQYTARYAEDLLEQGMIPLVLEFASDPRCCLGLAHCLDILEFCTQQSPATGKLLNKRRHKEQLEKAQKIAQTVAAVPQEVAWQMETFMLHLNPTAEEPANSLEQLLLGLPTELSEDNIALVSTTVMGIARSTTLRQQMRVAKGFPLLMSILTRYPHVPEVELKAVDVMWQLMGNAEDGLNETVAAEFCEGGGVECMIHIIGRYLDNPTVTEHCWDILASAVKLGPEAFCAPLKTNPEVLHLLAFSRTGGQFLEWLLGTLDALDILQSTIEAIHQVELKAGPEVADPPEETPEIARKAVKELEKDFRKDPALQALLVMTYMLVQALSRHLNVGPSRSVRTMAPPPFQEAKRLVEEGAARTLCRCLEAGLGRVPETLVLDILGIIRVLLTLGTPAATLDAPAANGTGAPDEAAPSTPLRNSRSAGRTRERPLGHVQDLQTEARMKSQIQVQSRIETLVALLSFYWWSDSVCGEASDVLYLLLMSVASVDDDDLASRLTKSSFAESCFELLFDKGPDESVLGLLQFVSSVEDSEELVWKLGGFDASYSCYLLTVSPVSRALCVAIMANHAMLDVDRRSWVANMGGLQMSQALVKAPVCWEETWVSMRMLAALAEPSDPFIMSTVCQGCLYVIADILSKVGVLRTTRATAQCLTRLLNMSLTFRKALADRRVAMPGFQPEANPEVDLWLTDDALTCPLEMLVYRVHQLFMEQVYDIETMDFAIQYIALLLGMRSQAISTRLLRCNTRLLLTNILGFKNLTPQLKKEANYCLEELHTHALSHAQYNFTGTVENAMPVTQKPAVPLLPQMPQLLRLPPPEEDEEVTPRSEFEHDPEDQAYLDGIGIKHLFNELTSVLLSSRPKQADVYDFLHKFIMDKYLRQPK